MLMVFFCDTLQSIMHKKYTASRATLQLYPNYATIAATGFHIPMIIQHNVQLSCSFISSNAGCLTLSKDIRNRIGINWHLGWHQLEMCFWHVCI